MGELEKQGAGEDISGGRPLDQRRRLPCSLSLHIPMLPSQRSLQDTACVECACSQMLFTQLPRRVFLGSLNTGSCIDRRPSDLRDTPSASGTLRAEYKILWCRLKMRNHA